MLAYITWNIDPEITRIFGFISLRYYSLLFVSGLIIGYLIVKRIYLKEGIPIESLERLSLYIFIGTIAGARLGHCMFYEPVYYWQHPFEMLLPFIWIPGVSFEFTGYQGLASHGGAIGVLLAIILYCKKDHVNLLWVLDRVSVAIPLTGSFIRIGNFMNSEIIGKPTNSSYGIVFQQVDLLPRHPAQLYEAISYLLIFVLLSGLFKKTKTNRKNGFLFGLFLVLLFGARFFIEFFKIIQSDFESGMALNMGQILSIPFLAVGIALMIWKRKSCN